MGPKMKTSPTLGLVCEEDFKKVHYVKLQICWHSYEQVGEYVNLYVCRETPDEKRQMMTFSIQV